MINREGLCYIILSPPPTYWRELHKQVLWGSDFSRENFSIQRSTFPRCPSRVIVPHTLKSLKQFIYIFFSFEQHFKMFSFCSWALTVWNALLFMRSELHSNAVSIWIWTDFLKKNASSWTFHVELFYVRGQERWYKDTPSSLLDNLIKTNQAYTCLGFWKSSMCCYLALVERLPDQYWLRDIDIFSLSLSLIN